MGVFSSDTVLCICKSEPLKQKRESNLNFRCESTPQGVLSCLHFSDSKTKILMMWDHRQNPDQQCTLRYVFSAVSPNEFKEALSQVSMY